MNNTPDSVQDFAKMIIKAWQDSQQKTNKLETFSEYVFNLAQQVRKKDHNKDGNIYTNETWYQPIMSDPKSPLVKMIAPKCSRDVNDFVKAENPDLYGFVEVNIKRINRTGDQVSPTPLVAGGGVK